MANYGQVSYGSKGSDVTELQKLLNNNGYNLSVDGDFGSKTQAAVKDYQQKNGLAVDGIAGTNTWGALTKANTATQTPTTPTETAPKYEAYKPSDTVLQAEAMLKEQMANKPGAYQSTWQDQLNGILQQINGGAKFEYDINGDALYQQYKDQGIAQGKLAMMDTMGQAAAMTGGYGNSYAQSVGQQAYSAELQKVNEMLPELYRLALDTHNSNLQGLYDQASLIGSLEDQDYGRYRDTVSDYYTQLGLLQDDARYKAEQEYGQWSDDRGFQYQLDRDKVEDEWKQKEFDEAVRQYNEQMALSKSKSSGSGSGGGGDSYTKNPGWDKAKIAAFQEAHGLTADGVWGPKTAAAYDKDPNWAGGGVPSFTGSTYKEAAAYLQGNGKPSSGLMTQSEWVRHKNGNNSGDGEHEAVNYQEYLAAFIYKVMNGL